MLYTHIIYIHILCICEHTPDRTAVHTRTDGIEHYIFSYYIPIILSLGTWLYTNTIYKYDTYHIHGMILYYNLRMYYKNTRAIFSGKQDGPNNFVGRYSISYIIHIYIGDSNTRDPAFSASLTSHRCEYII